MKIQRKSGFDPEFHQAIRVAVIAAHEILKRAGLDSPDLRDYLNTTIVKPSNRMIGAAGAARWRSNTITLNRWLLTIHPERLLETVVHEVCHLLDFKLNSSIGHGPSWKALMIQCGYQPVRCHTMDVGTLRRRNDRMDGK